MATQDQILKVVAGLFNGAPGGAILSDLTGAVESGLPVHELAAILADLDLFKEIVPDTATTEQKVETLLNNFGLEPGGEEGSAALLAEEYFTARIEEGADLGHIVYEAVVYLEQEDLPEEFAEVAALLDNKALVARVHAENYDDIDSVATGQSLFEGVTSEGPSTEADALAHIVDIIGEPGEEPGEPTPLIEALENLKAAQAAVDEFLADLVDNEVFLDHLSELRQEELQEDGAVATAGDIDDAVGKSEDDLADEIVALEVIADAAAFKNAGQNTREGLIADALAEAQEKVDDVAAGVAEAEAELATGVRDALTAAETARVALEDAYAAVAAAEAAQAEEITVFNTVNPGTYGFNGDDFVDGDGGVVATKGSTGQWTLGPAAEGLSRTADLLADLQANTDAIGAKEDAKDALDAAVLQVVRLENGDNSIALDDLASIVDSSGTDPETDATVVVLDFAADDGENAPEAQAYLDAVAALTTEQEAQTDLTDAIAAYRATGEISDNYNALVEAVEEARAAIEDSEEDGGLGITLFDLDSPVTAVDDDAELFLFVGNEASITNLGEDDLVFFGSDYTFVALTEDQTIDDRVGNANTLEIFWKALDDGNVALYVEQDAASGSVLGDAEITTVTLVGVTDVAFADGFVSIAAAA